MAASDRLRAVLELSPLQILPIPHQTLRVLAQNVYGRPAVVVDVPHDIPEYIDGTRGIRVLKERRAAGTYLRFESESDGLSALFTSLVDILLEATAGATTGADALARLLRAFEEFKTMLSARGDRLGENAIRGLFAELTLVESMLERGANPQQTMLAWQGPYRDAKDFILPGGSAIEVKSIRRQKHRVQISSVDQLDPRGELLTLAVLPIDQRVDGAGVPLLARIASVRQHLATDPRALSMYSDALEALRFDESNDYYATWRFDIGEWMWFHVSDDFPRISADDVPDGVLDVTFRLDTDALDAYAAEAPWKVLVP